MAPHDAKQKPSKDMDPFPKSFMPIFFRNQFLTKITIAKNGVYPTAGGKCAIVTGSNTGLGYEASRQLLSLGLSHLIMGVRSVDKGTSAAKTLQSEYPSSRIDVWQLDMESYDSIVSFVAKCQDLQHIDIVLLNAGISLQSFSVTKSTAHETTMQVNHYGTALLAMLLLPCLQSKATDATPSLTVVNSAMAHLCDFPMKKQRPLLAYMDDAKHFKGQERYGQSKLINQLFILKLAELVNPRDVIINMVDPGLTKGTGLFQDVGAVTRFISSLVLSIVGRSPKVGAATYVDAALNHDEASHGSFLMNCQHAP